jgi:hypothetical protein
MVPSLRLKASRIPVAGKSGELEITGIFVFALVGVKVFVAIAVGIFVTVGVLGLVAVAVGTDGWVTIKIAVFA